ncbi:MAG: prepilin-type N-terminal cleavage/methylation domain-containing protein [Gammaproteobacteria bacterium]|nr:prepilin-type N-terminal cleavage/methylation domain-containing protein [Gammaproteobacteria bacterium]
MRLLNGYTLIEMMIVVATIGILAVIALPPLSSGNPVKLDLAAAEIAAAARFARTEAIRTGTAHGINTSNINERVRVYSKPGLLPNYDVRHPVDKKLYDIALDDDSRMAGVDLSSASFNFEGSFSSSSYLGFSAEGIPKYSVLGTDYMLQNASITLTMGNDQRVVVVEPMTGRVSIQ